MKKLLRNLLCGGALAAMAMSANTANAAMYITGGNVDGASWSCVEMTQQTDGTYVWEGSILGSGFKFTDSTSWNGSYNLGGSSAITLGTAYTLTNSGSSGDIPLSNTSAVVKGPKVVLDVKNLKVTVTGTLEVLSDTKFEDYIYIIGNVTDWQMADTYKIPKTSDGIYSGSVKIPQLSDNYFRIYSSIEYGMSYYSYSPSTSDSNTKINTSNTFSNGTLVKSTVGCWYLDGWTGGLVEVTANFNTGKISFTMTEGTVLPEKMWLPGNFNDWTKDAEAYVLEPTQTEGTYSGTFNIPATVGTGGEYPQFKLHDGWSWIGTSESTTTDSGGNGNLAVELESGVPRVLSTSFSSDAANWYLEGWEGGEITFTYNYNEEELTLLWEDKPVVPEELYFIGDVYAYNNALGTSWDPTSPYAFTNNNNGTFTITGVELKNDGTSYFNFITATGTWDELKAGEPFRYGPETDNATANAVTVGSSVDMTLLAATTENSWNIADGVYDFTVDFNKGTFTVTASKTEPFIPDIDIPSALYLIGNLESTDGEWVLNESPQFTLTQTGVFIMNKVEFVAVDDNPQAFFGLANIQTETNDGDAWKEINNLHRYGPATADEEVALSPETNTLNWSTNNSWAIDPGVYNLVVDFKELTLTIEAVTEGGDDQTPDDEEDGAVALYLRGTFNSWGASDDYLLKNSEEAPEIYTGTFYIPMDDDVQFKIADASWGTHNYGAESVEAGQIAIYSDSTYTTTMTPNGSNLTITNWGGGQLVITFDLDTLKLTVEGPDQSGIKGLGSALNGDEAIYNLQGVRVDGNKLTRGIYIINGKKVMIK